MTTPPPKKIKNYQILPKFSKSVLIQNYRKKTFSTKKKSSNFFFFTRQTFLFFGRQTFLFFGRQTFFSLASEFFSSSLDKLFSPSPRILFFSPAEHPPPPFCFYFGPGVLACGRSEASHCFHLLKFFSSFFSAFCFSPTSGNLP